MCFKGREGLQCPEPRITFVFIFGTLSLPPQLCDLVRITKEMMSAKDRHRKLSEI